MAKSLDASSVHPDPLVQFDRWFDEWLAVDPIEPNALTLATADRRGNPSARMVLLKGVDADGFLFFTNYRSGKAKDLDVNPRAALVCYWPNLERQVRITGTVKKVPRRITAAYFRSRPLGARIGAWASPQSETIPDRAWLEARVEQLEKEFAGKEVPPPPHWGGYRLRPTAIEFWQGRPDRLHDRIRYVRSGKSWKIERLAP